MTLTYKEKFREALKSCETLEDFEYLQQKLLTTKKINRRTIKGREFTKELLNELFTYQYEFTLKNDLTPF